MLLACNENGIIFKYSFQDKKYYDGPRPFQVPGATPLCWSLAGLLWPGEEGVARAREQDNVPLQIFFLTRELPVLGDKDPAHVSRGEPTSCRYEVDPKPPGH